MRLTARSRITSLGGAGCVPFISWSRGESTCFCVWSGDAIMKVMSANRTEVACDTPYKTKMSIARKT